MVNSSFHMVLNLNNCVSIRFQFQHFILFSTRLLHEDVNQGKTVVNMVLKLCD